MPYFRRETPGAASYDRPDMRPIVTPGVQVVRGRRVRGIASRGPLSEVEQRIAPRAFGSRLLGGPRQALGAINVPMQRLGVTSVAPPGAGISGGGGAPSSVRFGAAAIAPTAPKRATGKTSTAMVATGPVYPSGDTLNTGTRGTGTTTGPGGTTVCYSRTGCTPPTPQPKTPPPSTKPAPSSSSTPNPNLQIGTGIGSPNVQTVYDPQATNYLPVLTGPVYPPDVIASPPAPSGTLDQLVAAATPYKTPLLLGGAALAAYYLFRK